MRHQCFEVVLQGELSETRQGGAEALEGLDSRHAAVCGQVANGCNDGRLGVCQDSFFMYVSNFSYELFFLALSDVLE